MASLRCCRRPDDSLWGALLTLQSVSLSVLHVNYSTETNGQQQDPGGWLKMEAGGGGGGVETANQHESRGMLIWSEYSARDVKPL